MNAAPAPSSPRKEGKDQDRGKGKGPSIIQLTANLHRQTLDDSFDADAAAESKDKRSLKDRILNPEDHGSSGDLPALDAWLQDQVWADGGELALHVGGTDADGRFESLEQIEIAVQNVTRAAERVGCHASLLRSGPVPRPSEEGNGPQTPGDVGDAVPAHKNFSAHLMIRRVPASAQELMEIRVAVVGNVDAGKSTMLGVLTKGTLDDGRGKARVNLFRHKHEIESGRTSSVGMEIMGYDAQGRPVTGAVSSKEDGGRKLTWEEVCEKAAKVISFIVSVDVHPHEQ